jgi:hypothetical protein
MRAASRALRRLEGAFDAWGHGNPAAAAAPALQAWAALASAAASGSHSGSSGPTPGAPGPRPAAAAGFSSSSGSGSSAGGGVPSTSGSSSDAGGSGGGAGAGAGAEGLPPELAAVRQSLLGGKRFYDTARVEAAPGQPVGGRGAGRARDGSHWAPSQLGRRARRRARRRRPHPSVIDARPPRRRPVLRRPRAQGCWQVLLDSFPVRTPARNLVVVPSFPLALALAAEWEWLVRRALGLGGLGCAGTRAQRPRLAARPAATLANGARPPAVTRLSLACPHPAVAHPPPQPNGKPIHHAMPLMSLVATAIDQVRPACRRPPLRGASRAGSPRSRADPGRAAPIPPAPPARRARPPSQPKPRSRVIDDLLKYIHTDAACVRYEPGPLAQRQAAVRGGAGARGRGGAGARGRGGAGARGRGGAGAGGRGGAGASNGRRRRAAACGPPRGTPRSGRAPGFRAKPANPPPRPLAPGV